MSVAQNDGRHVPVGDVSAAAPDGSDRNCIRSPGSALHPARCTGEAAPVDKACPRAHPSGIGYPGASDPPDTGTSEEALMRQLVILMKSIISLSILVVCLSTTTSPAAANSNSTFCSLNYYCISRYPNATGATDLNMTYGQIISDSECTYPGFCPMTSYFYSNGQAISGRMNSLRNRDNISGLIGCVFSWSEGYHFTFSANYYTQYWVRNPTVSGSTGEYLSTGDTYRQGYSSTACGS